MFLEPPTTLPHNSAFACLGAGAELGGHRVGASKGGAGRAEEAGREEESPPVMDLFTLEYHPAITEVWGGDGPLTLTSALGLRARSALPSL